MHHDALLAEECSFGTELHVLFLLLGAEMTAFKTLATAVLRGSKRFTFFFPSFLLFFVLFVFSSR